MVCHILAVSEERKHVRDPVATPPAETASQMVTTPLLPTPQKPSRPQATPHPPCLLSACRARRGGHGASYVPGSGPTLAPQFELQVPNTDV